MSSVIKTCSFRCNVFLSLQKKPNGAENQEQIQTQEEENKNQKVCSLLLSRFSTRRIFLRTAEWLLYLHCLFLTMVTSRRSATRVLESRIDLNFSAASDGANQSNRSKALTNDINIQQEGKPRA